jgi:lipoprotein-releasing system permease protein
MSRFEWAVALRYLRAKRKQTVISVITAIAVLGVAAGVAALIIALAINNGFGSTLQNTLLGATAHVNVLERNSTYGIENWQKIASRLRALPHVVAATPGLYSQVAIKGPVYGGGAVLKGVPLGKGIATPDLLRHLKSGNLALFATPEAPHSIVLGSRLAEQIGAVVGARVTLISYQGQLTPLGVVPSLFHFKVAAIFESGLYDIDSTWAFTSLAAAQQVLDLADVVNTIELRLDDVFAAPRVAREAEQFLGTALIATTWMDQNRSLLNALRLERVVSIITVSLIELVATLNILVVLVMLVMEKHRDIAILLAMGTRRGQIQRIFVLQGLIIGGLGAVLGLVVGYSITMLFNHYRLLRLDEQVYALSYVPFVSYWTDGLWVSALALVTSFVATLHPSRTASRIAPAEALRYE